jgi:exopolysaccharide biosynthesis protein
LRKTSLDREINSAKKNSKKKKNSGKKFLSLIFNLCTIGCLAGMFLLYGPYYGFRDWLITTSQSTMTHQYLSTWFYDDDTINDCLNRNTIEQAFASIDTDSIHFINPNIVDTTATYENEYEEAVLKRSAKNNDYKIIKISGDKYSGYLAVIYDPSRIKVVATSKLGTSGEYLTTMSKNNNALVAINGGGFADANGDGDGSLPTGITISSGTVLTDNTYASDKVVVGFNTNNVLMFGRYSVSQAKAQNLRDAVTFGPALITNGEASVVSGDGGLGRAPRTAIAQRSDGIVLFLVLDGNRNLGQGATVADEIEILQNYGAINAVNLDGGTSTGMTVKNTIINDPTAKAGDHRTRTIATAFILEADSSDDGDYSIVANKLK